MHSHYANDPIVKTYLKLPGIPENRTNVKYWHFELNYYQSVYQDYQAGLITKEQYDALQIKYGKFDTSKLSKNPIKSKIGLAY